MQQKTQTASKEPVRVRFAPSPTGHLHVGGARTALFNWLWARKLRGTFVLRIEDTDAERSTEESLRGILEGLRWLGLHWDEGPEVGGAYGPYLQSLRQVVYRGETDRLFRQGNAYLCFCTREDLDAMREKAMASGQPVRYDGRCRERDVAKSQALVESGEKAVVRLRMPEGLTVAWTDLVRGDCEFQGSVLDDFVLLKSDGNPTYNFAVVVDDAKMRISHVIRGDDHISNTPRQLVLFDLLGFGRPEYAHLPMIVGPDKARLSKRHGATSVTQFRELGILPPAMMNYLALLGWAYDDKHEVFLPAELVSHFDLKSVSRTPAIFDLQKLQWMNREHFSRMSLGRKLELLLPQMKARGLWPPQFRVDLGPARHFRVVTGAQEDKVAASIFPVSDEEWMKEEPSLSEELPRLKMILDALGNRLGGPQDVQMLDYFYTEGFPYESEAVAKHLASEETAQRLEALADAFESLAAYTLESIEETIRAFAKEQGVKAGQIIHPARVAVTGRTVSGGLFEVLFLVGRAKTVERLRRVRHIVEHNRLLDPPASTGTETDRAIPPPEHRPPRDPGSDFEIARRDTSEEPPHQDT